MRDNARTVVFAVVLALVCSVILTATSLYTAPYRSANEKAEEVRNFLSALEVPVEADADAAALLDVFDKNVRKRTLGDLPLYEYVPDVSGSETPIAVAVPFSGPGLWGPINGVLALEPDLSRIRGIRFYKHEETPGLGGEISADWFQKRFVGKEILPGAGKDGLSIVKSGRKLGENSVDGITGATMTCDRVQTMLAGLATALGKERNNYVQ
ncbi:MAG: FMN-binding protein [Candidatus Latescibacterota bacterium]